MTSEETGVPLEICSYAMDKREIVKKSNVVIDRRSGFVEDIAAEFAVD